MSPSRRLPGAVQALVALSLVVLLLREGPRRSGLGRRGPVAPGVTLFARQRRLGSP